MSRSSMRDLIGCQTNGPEVPAIQHRLGQCLFLREAMDRKRSQQALSSHRDSSRIANCASKAAVQPNGC